MKDFFKSYKNKYNKAHKKYISTIFGLTPADWKAGITRIEQKLENMCPLYAVLMARRDFSWPWRPVLVAKRESSWQR
jgi:hypothetical protein